MCPSDPKVDVTWDDFNAMLIVDLIKKLFRCVTGC